MRRETGAPIPMSIGYPPASAIFSAPPCQSTPLSYAVRDPVTACEGAIQEPRTIEHSSSSRLRRMCCVRRGSHGAE